MRKKQEALEKVNERLVGLVREARRYPVSRQREMLWECGRVWGYDEIDRMIRYLRAGDIVVVAVAHALGSSRLAVLDTMSSIFAKGAGVSVLEPKHLIARNGFEAAEIALQAVAGLTGDSRAHTAEEAARHGKKSWKRKKAKRTPFETAHKFWRSKRGQDMIVEERLAQSEMAGWTVTTFYRHLKLNT